LVNGNVLNHFLKELGIIDRISDYLNYKFKVQEMIMGKQADDTQYGVIMNGEQVI
jgi:hypothetical protein